MASSSVKKKNLRQKNDVRPGRLTGDEADSKLQSRDEPIRVGICDASATVRYGLETIFESAPGIEVEMVATNLTEALEQLSDIEVDVMMADIDDWGQDEKAQRTVIGIFFYVMHGTCLLNLVIPRGGSKTYRQIH